MFDVQRFARKIHDQLTGRAVGFQYAVYRDETLCASGAGGHAVLSPAIYMTPDHRMTTASMSKTITATAFMQAMEILSVAGVDITVDSKIASHLPVAWTLGPHVKDVTFKHLLAHTSGLRSAHNDDEDLFESLRRVIATGSTDANWNTYLYQNCNYALLRVLIPNLLYGVVVSSDNLPEGEHPDHYTAMLYFNFVRDHVLEPVGLNMVSLAPRLPQERITYYNFDDRLKTWNDQDLLWYLVRVGAGHWFMSAKEIGRFVAGLRSGRIVSDVSFKQMENDQFGMFRSDNTIGGPNWNHDGSFDRPNGAGMSGDLMLLPHGITAVCQVNSRGGLKKSVQEVFWNAFNAASLSPPTTGTAVAGATLNNGLHLFLNGPDNRLYVNRATDGQPFAGWMGVEGQLGTTFAPAAAALGKRIYAFAVGGQGGEVVHVNSMVAGQPFDGWGQGWVRLDGVATDAAPAAASVGNRIYAFAKSVANHIRVNTAVDGGSFGGWQEVEGDRQTKFAPAAAGLGNRVYVFAVGGNGDVYVNSAVSGQPFDGWGHGWAPLAGMTTDAAPAAASVGSRIYVFVKGVDDHLYVNSALDGQPFGGWKAVDGNETTELAPGAAALGNRVYVFVRGVSKRVFVNSAVSGNPFDGWGRGWTEVQW